jgi:hypothetical protein
MSLLELSLRSIPSVRGLPCIGSAISFSANTPHDDLAEEIREHIAERTAALIEQGRSREEAEREARRAFGNRTLAREHSIEVWQWRWLENLWADLRFALHQLRKSPGYTLTAILTLAIDDHDRSTCVLNESATFRRTQYYRKCSSPLANHRDDEDQAVVRPAAPD